jgi:molybdate/tungstate transport system substrate-binding protein
MAAIPGAAKRRMAMAHAGSAGLRTRRGASWLLGFLLCALWLAPAARAGTVAVLYAGSLVNLMERSIGPAFDKASGDRFQGYAGGSKLLAHQITAKLRQADVFISAAPAVNRSLMGAANGNWVSWYITFAQSPLVIGYNPQSRFAAAFKSKPWYQVLMEKGIRIGRTDPKLDPKGALTIALMRRAAAFYKVPGLAQRVLGAPENPAQVLPEEALVGQLQSGQLDAGFFYSTETSAARIPTVRLPARITPKAVYTVTIPRNAPDPNGAERFVAYLLGPPGQELLKKNGLVLEKPVLEGAISAVPPQLRALVAQGR